MKQGVRQKRVVKAKPDDAAQYKKFVNTAREIGADGESSAADTVIGRLAKQAPEPRKPQK
jgi:hypothetical protein